MLEKRPENTNMTEDAPEEAEPLADQQVPVEEEVPEGVAESAAGTEEAADASDEPSPVPEEVETAQSTEEERTVVETAEEAPAEAPAEEAPAEEAALHATTTEVEQGIEQEQEAPADARPPAEPSGNGDSAAEVAEAPEEELGADPYGGPGDWYVIHTYAGYENKVKTNLASRIQTMQMQDKIFDVVIPMEDVMEIKGGRKQVVQKKVFPGYLLVKMIYDDESWFVVRNTPGVTGFVSSGTGQKPTPLSRREVERILGRKKEEAKPAFRLDFEVDDVVRIISGPFADFNGTIAEINVDQSKVKVMVNIFDRETPVELGFDQVARV
ncbi:MAG TPA: transcription termination/antitermination protein NusG [Actinomycetota bacterium]|jgi:transcriptional antiterminator NusG|nr:transcription termination/antitermination protein NusG [Actinomycetota bacterium]